ncbi:Hypothetical predicted protein, partial [Pelobates cultripes]
GGDPGPNPVAPTAATQPRPSDNPTSTCGPSAASKIAGAMCAEFRGKNCSLPAPTAISAVPGHKLDVSAAFLPHNANRQNNSHPSPQQYKPAANCAGDPTKLMTAAALKGQNAAQRPFPPMTTDPAAKRGTSATGPTSQSPYAHLELRQPRIIQRGSRLQVLLDCIQFPALADTSLLMIKYGRLK